MTSEHIEAAAADFARHTAAGEGWALGLAVASCVQPGSGSRNKSLSNRKATNGKVSAAAFAKQANTSPARVLRYLEAWNLAAEIDVVLPSEKLFPEDWNDTQYLPIGKPGSHWPDFYDASSSGGRPRDSKVEDAATIIEKRGAAAVVEALTPEQKHEVTAALVTAAPEAVTEAVIKAAPEKVGKAVAANPKAKSASDRAHAKSLGINPDEGVPDPNDQIKAAPGFLIVKLNERLGNAIYDVAQSIEADPAAWGGDHLLILLSHQNNLDEAVSKVTGGTPDDLSALTEEGAS